MAEQVPSVGRVVHFVREGKHQAAIITDPGENVDAMQSLTVFPADGAPYITVAPRSDDATNNTWHWPEYVPAK